MVTVNEEKSTWKSVTSGIPQGSVLGPILFVLFINDLPDLVNSSIYLFADDTKIFNKIQTIQDATILQDDLNILSDWSDQWLLRFHPEKCKLIHFGKNNSSSPYTLNSTNLQSANQEKDIYLVLQLTKI